MSIANVIEELKQTNKLSVNHIKSCITKEKFTLQEISRFVTTIQPRKLSYYRNVIVETPELQIVLISIPPKQSTDIHDHGVLIGGSLIIEGNMINKIYRKVEQDFELVEEIKYKEEDFIVIPYGQTHSIYNPDEEVILHSLNIYAKAQ